TESERVRACNLRSNHIALDFEVAPEFEVVATVVELDGIGLLATTPGPTTGDEAVVDHFGVAFTDDTDTAEAARTGDSPGETNRSDGAVGTCGTIGTCGSTSSGHSAHTSGSGIAVAASQAVVTGVAVRTGGTIGTSLSGGA